MSKEHLNNLGQLCEVDNGISLQEHSVFMSGCWNITRKLLVIV